MNKTLTLTILCLVSGPISFSQKPVYEPKRGSEERKVHMELLRTEFTPAFNGQKLVFEVIAGFYHSNGEWAFTYVNAYQQGGKPVDFKNSRYRKDFEDEMIDSNGIFALLKKTKNRWVLITHIAFPTDVPVGCWWKEYNAPKNIFGTAAEDAANCQAGSK